MTIKNETPTDLDPLEIGRLAQFAREILMPAGAEVLADTYRAYCSGEDIRIQTKDDNSPASAADREAEDAIRYLIKNIYPDHGIWGEEYGTYQIHSDYVWVLDPLDGTKEFLAKNPHHFGLLIGLVYKGQPIYGLCHDPIAKETWDSLTIAAEQKVSTTLKTASIATTSRTMFDDLPNRDAFINLLDAASPEYSLLNCIGFVQAARGMVDVVIENKLALHDIVPLLPILKAAGAHCVDFNGKPYADYTLDLNENTIQKYNIIASLNPNLVDQILKEIHA